MFGRALILSAALLVAPAAEAAPRNPLMMARVAVGDLDLSTGPGARAMLRRLNAAARKLCGEEFSPLFPSAPGRAWRCRHEAVAAAVQRLNAPQLTLAFAEQLSTAAADNP